MNKKVSILIPCYNSEAYLAETIGSAIKQSWQNKEIIIVNDGSTDRTGEIAESFASDIVRVFHETNAGACKARNLAFEKSTGDYIQYLDADDLLSQKKIEGQMRLLLDEEPGTVASSAWRIFYKMQGDTSKQSLPIFRDYDRPIDMLLEMWTNGYMMQTGAWLVPRNIVERAGKWDEALTINQDGEFFCRILLNASKVKFSAEGEVFYRKDVPGSVSRVQGKRHKMESLLRTFQLYEKGVLEVENSNRVKQALAKNYYSFIYQYYDSCPDLSLKAKNIVNSWGIPPMQIGGKSFRALSRIFGFYNTLRLRGYLKRKSSTDLIH